MLTKNQILNAFEKINEILRVAGQKGEIGIVGGAVMCLVYNARNSTKDVDAIFEPSQLIRAAAIKVAAQASLPKDWLNDAVKGYLVKNFKKNNVRIFSNLEIWAPEPTYMLAMKCISARYDTSDKDDVIFLIKYLNLKKPYEVFNIIEDYYPKGAIPSKTKFFIEELLE